MDVDLVIKAGVALATLIGTVFLFMKFWIERAPRRKAKNAMEALLKDESHSQRFFTTIRDKVGGFDDDELRRMLLELGAVRFIQKDSGDELWGLKPRDD